MFLPFALYSSGRHPLASLAAEYIASSSAHVTGQMPPCVLEWLVLWVDSTDDLQWEQRDDRA